MSTGMPCSLTLLVAWGLIAVAACRPPRPQRPDLPNEDQLMQQVHRGMTRFNTERFALERAILDSLSRPFEARLELPGGVWVVWVREARAGMPASVGEEVTMTWSAHALDGDSLCGGKEVFQVGGGGVPQAFQEISHLVVPGDSVMVWSPSNAAFGVRGIPGCIAPYTPLVLHVGCEGDSQSSNLSVTPLPMSDYSQNLERDAIDGRRGAGRITNVECEDERSWLTGWIQRSGFDTAKEIVPGVWCLSLEDLGHPRPDGPHRMTLKTQAVADVWSEECQVRPARETCMEWVPGAPDQIVPGLQEALASYESATHLLVWAISSQAFGEKGVPQAGIPASSPVCFEVSLQSL